MTTSKAADLGTKDGRAAKAKLERKGRAFTPFGAAQASGDGFMRRLERRDLDGSAIVEYGTAFINAAAG